MNIKRFLTKNLLWIIFFVFALLGILTRKDASILISQSQYGVGKYIIWGLFISFFSYTVHASRKENFYKSMKYISRLYWGRQVILDLYIGLMLPLLIIYLHGGGWVLLLWLLPILLNANLFTLLYFALNYDSLIDCFNK